MIYHDLKLLKKLKHVKITETTKYNASISSTNVFNFLKSELTSVK